MGFSMFHARKKLMGVKWEIRSCTWRGGGDVGLMLTGYQQNHLFPIDLELIISIRTILSANINLQDLIYNYQSTQSTNINPNDSLSEHIASISPPLRRHCDLPDSPH